MNNRDRKLEVFIGATRKDLHYPRELVIHSLLEAGHIPSGMELWAAGHIPTKEAILTHLRRCDVHVVILGARYGYVPAAQKISFVEWEYDTSIEDGRPVIAFLLDDGSFKKARARERRVDMIEKKYDKDITRFREKLMSSRFVKFFGDDKSGHASLSGLTRTAITELINSNRLADDAGWIKAASEDASRLREISKNAFLDRVLKTIHDFSKLTERVVQDEPAKRALSKVFWHVMTGRIRRKEFRHLFFESGSTLAYVSNEFEEQILKRAGDISEWRITTNNAVTLLQLLLHTHVHVRPLPSAAPENRYGAMFPASLGAFAHSEPRRPRRLHPDEAKAVSSLRQILIAGTENCPTVFLATTSGLDLDHKNVEFRGPHVGSHPNMLFKRAMIQVGQPLVLFLSARKVGDPFRIEKCYPVCGPEMPWRNVVKKYPLAICVGYAMPSPIPVVGSAQYEETKRHNDLNNPSRLRSALVGLGLDADYAGRQLFDGGAIIAANEAFKKVFPLE